MNTIIIKYSEESIDWRDGCSGGTDCIAVNRCQRPSTQLRKLKIASLVAVSSSIMGFALAASAVNIPSIANTVNVNNAPNATNVINPGNAPKTATTGDAPRHWAADTSNGCKVWSPEALARDTTVRWSGRCEDGLAQGQGTVRWLNNNKQVAELAGTLNKGKIRGHTSGVEEPGNRFEGMFIDSLPEGEGKATYADGSIYMGQWHRGRQLGYGIMTFPPAHPQYQEMVSNGRGRKIENGVYALRGWWEGKTFVTACDSEEECEKAVVALMKREQDAAAGKAAVTVPSNPAIAPAAPATSAEEPATPAAESTAVPATPLSAPPVTEPVVVPGAPPASPLPPSPAVEPAAVPASSGSTVPAVERVVVPVASVRVLFTPHAGFGTLLVFPTANGHG